MNASRTYLRTQMNQTNWTLKRLSHVVQSASQSVTPLTFRWENLPIILVNKGLMHSCNPEWFYPQPSVSTIHWPFYDHLLKLRDEQKQDTSLSKEQTINSTRRSKIYVHYLSRVSKDKNRTFYTRQMLEGLHKLHRMNGDFMKVKWQAISGRGMFGIYPEIVPFEFMFESHSQRLFYGFPFQVNIFYRSNNVEEIREVPQYPSNIAVLNALGGALSLWLGLSLLTACDCVELLFRTFWTLRPSQ